MLLIFSFAICLALAQCEGLQGRNVIFIVDAMGLDHGNEGENVLQFVNNIAKDSLHKGANVGIVFGEESLINTQLESGTMSVDRKVMFADTFVGHVGTKLRGMTPDQIGQSSIGTAINTLFERITTNAEFQSGSTIVVLITASHDIDTAKISELSSGSMTYGFRMANVLIGKHHYDLAWPGCLNLKVGKAADLNKGINARARIGAIVYLLAESTDDQLLDEFVLCKKIDSATQLEIEIIDVNQETEAIVSGKISPPELEVIRNQQVVEDQKMIKEHGITDSQRLSCYQCDDCGIESPDSSFLSPCPHEDQVCFIAMSGGSVVRGCESSCSSINLPAFKRYCCTGEMCNEKMPNTWSKGEIEEPIKSETEIEDSDHMKMISTTNECFSCDGYKCRLSASIVDTKTRKCRMANPVCFVGLIDDQIVRGCETADNCLDMNEPDMKRKCCSGDLCNTLAPTEWFLEHADNATNRKEKLLCYRCDGCTPDTPNLDQVVECGPIGVAGCYIATVGSGPSTSFVRGCEHYDRCTNIDSPLMKRKCCNDRLCNDQPPTEWFSREHNEMLENEVTTTRKITTTTKISFPEKEFQPRSAVDKDRPLADMDLYILLDFAAIRRFEEEKIVENVKKVAVDSVIRGADVALVSGSQVRRLSPTQINHAFPDSEATPEQVMEKFQNDLHISSAIHNKRGNSEWSTTTFNPRAESSLAESFGNLIHHLQAWRNDIQRDLVIVFVTAASIPPMYGMKLWETHQVVMPLAPHYISLLVGKHGRKPEPEAFQELLETNSDPECFLMQFEDVDEFMDKKTAIDRRLVETAKYLRDHQDMSGFQCDVLDVLPEETVPTTETTQVMTTEPSFIEKIEHVLDEAKDEVEHFFDPVTSKTIIVNEPEEQEVEEVEKRSGVEEEDTISSDVNGLTTTKASGWGSWFGFAGDDEKEETTETTTTEAVTTSSVVVATTTKSKAKKTEEAGKIEKGTLKCYHCENCTDREPSSEHIMDCEDEETQTGFGVCFIQSIGSRINRGCVSGFECIESQSELMSFHCCDDHSLCNDKLPSGALTANDKESSGASPVIFNFQFAILAILAAEMI